MSEDLSAKARERFAGCGNEDVGIERDFLSECGKGYEDYLAP